MVRQEGNDAECVARQLVNAVATPQTPAETHILTSKMSHPRCVYISNRCLYHSITRQYLKRCLTKDEVNYMFRPNVAIIRFSSESMLVVLYRIGMGMSRW